MTIEDTYSKASNGMKLTVIIPVWNEEKTIAEIIQRVENVSAAHWHIEIIIVDDASTDGTRVTLIPFQLRHTVIYHDTNRGKGSAVATGLARATGDYILIQDADLEYNPKDIPLLLHAIGTNHAQAVYGSRNIDPRTKKGGMIPRLGVWFLTQEFNLLFRTHLTDLWTCYKLFPREVAKYFSAGHFESELSFSARLITHGFTIIEVPISYNPRPTTAGKKIRYRDGLWAIWIILKEWLSR